MAMNLKYLIIFSFLVLNYSCTKEEPEKLDKTLESIDCEVEFADDVRLLETSLAAVTFYNSDENKSYKDNSGTKHSFQSTKEEFGVVCFHEWTCDLDPRQRGTFMAKRHLTIKTLSSNTSDYQFKYSFSTSLNEKHPLKYSDIFNIEIIIGEEHNCQVSTFVIDPRNDSAATNDLLILHEQIQLDGFPFYDVYEDKNEEFEVLFNMQDGLIQVKDLINEVSYLLMDE